MDGLPQNGAGHTQQHNLSSPFDSNQHHHQSQLQHPYYQQQQQQQYDPASYTQQQQHQHYYHHQHQPQQSHNEPVQSPVPQHQHPQYYSNHQEAWGNANNLQAYAYYNQQPQQTYQHHHQQQAPPSQHHQLQDESLAHLSRFVNQPPVSTAHTSGMSMSQQHQRGPASNGNVGRPGPGSSPGSSGMQLMPVRLQNVKGARTKAGMRKLIQEQSLTPTPTPTSSGSPAKKKKLAKDSYDEAIEATVESSSSHASPTFELEHSLTKKPKGRPKKKSEQEPSSSPVMVKQSKVASVRRDSEVDAAQLLLDLKESPPAKVEPKTLRRSVSQEKKSSAHSPLVAESKKKIKRELEEHEHEIIHKEMVPEPTSNRSPGTGSSRTPDVARQTSKNKKKKKVKAKVSVTPSSTPQSIQQSLASNFEDPKGKASESPVTKRIRNVRRQTSESPVQSQVKAVTPTLTPAKGSRERSPKRLTPKAEESTIKSESPDIEIVEEINHVTPTTSSPSKAKAANSNATPKTERERKPKGRPKGSKTKNRRVLPGERKINPKNINAASTTQPATTPRPKPAIGLLDRRAMFKGPRVPTVKRVESASSSGVKKTNPKVPIVGPSIRVKNGKVKFYRGSDEEDVDEPHKKLLQARDPIGKSRSAKIETDNTDGPWICVFCKLGPHAVQLGDLFGPYFVQSSKDGVPHKRETWVHTDCALWAGDVFLVGDTLRNLDSAVEEADEIVCKICSKDGATIGCIKRGCKETSHFPCAQQNGWNLDENTYHSYCRSHAALGSNIPSSRK